MFDLKKKFKGLKTKDVPQGTLLRQRAKLEAHMIAHPMQIEQRAPRFQIFAFKPVLATFTILIVFSSTGGVVFASQASLPGESLYSVKLASEEVRARLALSEDAKFRYRSKLAEKRLKEAEVLYSVEGMENRVERVSIAMRRYEQHVNRLNAIAEKFEEHDRPKNPERALEAINRVLGTHARLLESATNTEKEIEVAVGAYAEGTIHLEEKLMKRIKSMEWKIDEKEELLMKKRGYMLKLREGLKDAEDFHSKSIDGDKNTEEEYRREKSIDNDEDEVNDDLRLYKRWPEAWNTRDRDSAIMEIRR